MNQISLKYLGKKAPRVVDTPLLAAKYTFENDPVWVIEADAKWLMANNPKMFQKVGERETPVQIVEDIKPKIEPEEIKQACPKCGKGESEFKTKAGFSNHIRFCRGE